MNTKVIGLSDSGTIKIIVLNNWNAFRIMTKQPDLISFSLEHIIT